MTAPTRLIALDWGSSSLRACRLGEGGELLEERASEDGASRLHGGAPAFEAALLKLAGDWLRAAPAAPLLASGMVGSAHGWREAPYVHCPATLDELGAHAVHVPLAGHAGLRIVPGVALREAGRAPDVMRGEETQIAGLLHARPALRARARLVLPGTHSKWVRVEGGRITAFHTTMTGELFALLREHSVLARLMLPSDGFHAEAFLQGVRAVAQNPAADLGQLLFSVRALGLFQQLPGPALADYLSGLLIGSELRGALAAPHEEAPLVLIGAAALCERYALALQAFGHGAESAPAALAAAGLWHIAQAAGWLAPCNT